MEKLISINELAALLGVKKSTIYQWTHRHFIPFIKMGGQLRFWPSKVEKWLERMSEKGRTVKPRHTLGG